MRLNHSPRKRTKSAKRAAQLPKRAAANTTTRTID